MLLFLLVRTVTNIYLLVLVVIVNFTELLCMIFLHVTAFLFLARSRAKFDRYLDSELIYRYVHVLQSVSHRYNVQHFYLSSLV